MKTKNSFVSIILFFTLCSFMLPTNLCAQFRGLSGRRALLAARAHEKQKEKFEELKRERDELAIKALKGDPTAYVALEKNMNNKLAAAGAAAALAAATMYKLQKRIALLSSKANACKNENQEINKQVRELTEKNKKILAQINQMTGKNLTLEQANELLTKKNKELGTLTKELSSDREQLLQETKKRKSMLKKYKASLNKVHKEALLLSSDNEGLSIALQQAYQNNFALLEEFERKFKKNVQDMQRVTAEAEELEQIIGTAANDNSPKQE